MANASGIKAGQAYVELVTDDKTAEGLARAQERFARLGTTGLKIGGAIMAAKAAAAALNLVSAGIEGNWEKIEETVRGLPMGVGQFAGAAIDLFRTLEKPFKELKALQKDFKFDDATLKSWDHFGKLVRTARRDIETVGMSPEQRQRYDIEQTYTDRMEAIKTSRAAGGLSAGLAGAAGREADAARRAQLAEVEAEAGRTALKAEIALTDELARARADALDDELAKTMETLRLDEAARLRGAQKAGEDVLAIEALFAARRATVQRDHDRRLQADQVAARRQQLQEHYDAAMAEAERGLDLEERTAEEVARLRIEATQDGLDRELATIAHERAKALAEARALGIDVGGIEEKFGLMGQLARARNVEPAMALGGVGTFNPAAMAGLLTGTAMDRTAKATEDTAKNSRRILDEAQRGKIVFGAG